MTVTLKPDLEEELTARAQAEGLTTEDFVNRELEKLVAREQASPELSAEERARILEEWIANHSVGGPPLSDYAVSRESIYKEREDAQL
jgi:L-fucose isomerase-like protein